MALNSKLLPNEYNIHCDSLKERMVDELIR